MAAPILPNPVDRVEILTVVDNVLDLLLLSTDVAKRMGPGGPEGRRAPVPRCAAAGVGPRRGRPGGRARPLLPGVRHLREEPPDGALRSRLQRRWTGTQSPRAGRGPEEDRGHRPQPRPLRPCHRSQRAGGAARAAPPAARSSDAWLKRRVAIPGREPFELPTTSKENVRAAGFELTEERQPCSLLDGGLLVTGEIERTTEFERGLPVQQAFRDGNGSPTR